MDHNGFLRRITVRVRSVRVPNSVLFVLLSGFLCSFFAFLDAIVDAKVTEDEDTAATKDAADYNGDV